VVRCILTILTWPDTNINSAEANLNRNEHSTAETTSSNTCTMFTLPTPNTPLYALGVKRDLWEQKGITSAARTLP
jgi:hypothetical protein